MNKKEWLDHLYYEVGNQQYDFFVCGLNKVGDEVKATKWKKYSEVCFPLDPWEYEKIKWVNQRQILPNEIVLDIEDKERLPEIITKLKTKLPFIPEYYLYSTGSRGYHIHIFSIFEIIPEIKRDFIKIFGADVIKAGSKTMIALENFPHWKTGKIKELVKDGDKI